MNSECIRDLVTTLMEMRLNDLTKTSLSEVASHPRMLRYSYEEIREAARTCLQIFGK